MKEANNYIKLVEWSSEDNCYIGSCPGLFLGGVHGTDEVKVYKELCTLVNEWVATHKADKKPLPKPTALKKYSGKFILRVSADLHKKLHIKALTEGLSINNLCQKLLTKSADLRGAV
jgi:predicted HicB family RNase H-like nuclease